MKTSSKVATDGPTFIRVTKEEGGIIKSIRYSYNVYEAEKNEGDKYTQYYIPGYEIYFYAKNKEDGNKIAQATMTAFFNYWVKNQGKKAFLEEIERLGFEEVKSSKNNTLRFSSTRPSVPKAFTQSNTAKGELVAA
jgi:hypothetical protein